MNSHPEKVLAGCAGLHIRGTLGLPEEVALQGTGLGTPK